jgi:hypothetical protein
LPIQSAVVKPVTLHHTVKLQNIFHFISFEYIQHNKKKRFQLKLPLRSQISAETCKLSGIYLRPVLQICFTSHIFQKTVKIIGASHKMWVFWIDTEQNSLGNFKCTNTYSCPFSLGAGICESGGTVPVINLRTIKWFLPLPRIERLLGRPVHSLDTIPITLSWLLL